MAEPSLGEILGEALAGPRPLSFVEQVVVAAITDQAFLEVEAVNNLAMFRSACMLSSDIAGLIGSTADEVYDVLGHVPDNMLELLKSPQGWTTLAGYVAGDLGRPMPDYRPTIH